MGEDGNPITPEQAAQELVDALEDVEVTSSTSGKKDAVGWTLAIGLKIQGLAEKPLLLTWSLDGPDVSDEWKVKNLAYRIIATSELDTGSVKIWVPDLKGPGPHTVNVELVHEFDHGNADLASPYVLQEQ